METAVSCGVLAPMSRPMGERRRASSASVRPSSTSSARRRTSVARDPIAPTNATGRRSAATSSGTSKRSSWVSTQITVRASTSVRARYSSGHSATTSWADGKRARVAKAGRASHTVTR
ncbi:hypothetical protein BC477_12040 [Clavibacter michiganensis subsp. michiganensis]|uniref:Uncharacterized protein n=1 Tax=Clavibacter michiganensis subsp. michiganensis TaxID=33013 RepID=A0A251XI72_CLAMM|nr:hypothetical protein BC477_12040 [Clavibacter michiganensis subsp. michiganensis]OUE02526.1 hypothetical protein CMMCAS07_10950 [Clavibacter michiganensis subsp. michiganensis]